MWPLLLVPTAHEPCLYSGHVGGERVLLKRQVDDFEVAAKDERTASLILDEIDVYLMFSLKQLGLVTLFNWIDLLQTRWYIKLSVETYIERICGKYLNTWMDVERDKARTPLPTKKEFIRGFLSTVGEDNTVAQSGLAKEMGIGYRNGVGEVIFAMITARPDMCHTVTRLSQHNSRPHKIHYVGL